MHTVQATSSLLLLVWNGKPCFVLIYFFDLTLFHHCGMFFTTKFHTSFKTRSILADKTPSDNYAAKSNATGLHACVCHIYLYVHSPLYILSAISSSLCGGYQDFQTKWRLAVYQIDILQQTTFAFTNKQNSIIWGPSNVSITAKYGFWCSLHVSSGKILCFILL